MLALDQREALRVMMRERTGHDVSDADLTAFKVAAARALTPHASALLVEKQFGWDAIIQENAVSPGCALIAAADHFVPGTDEFIAESVIDEAIDPAVVRDQGAAALKLLVIWRPDGDPDARRALVSDFVDRCRAHGLASIVEPVSRKPTDGGPFDADAGIVAAARELGGLGADVYKSEVPTHGAGTDDEIFTRCKELDEAIDGHWVVLSSGVPAERFPETVALACRAGASGFLAGRAVWASVVGSADLETDLRNQAVPALQRLVRTVDETVSR
ncbi:aldolase [Phytoactinopolyspora halotolerans]|uniref:Aldolase n=2 Tax=Phytoactinopolyspora halotolerans TaxID=1981512 RepID=A0A6L9S9R3_9ACTN|nr:aldolase [Phytoactinopolyspora halotolerans]